MTQTQIQTPSRCIWVGKTRPEVKDLTLWAGSQGLALASPLWAATAGISQSLAKLPSTQGWGLSPNPTSACCFQAQIPRDIFSPLFLKLTLLVKEENICLNAE